MFGSDYFGKDYFGQDYFANELVSPRGRDFFGPNTTAFFDNFNRADGDPGNGWTRSNSNVQILNNELITNFSSNGEFTLIQSGLFTGAAAQNKYVQVQMRYLNSTPFTPVTIYWILIISYTDINNWVGVKCYAGVAFSHRTKCDLISRVAGVDTILASAIPALPISATGYNITDAINYWSIRLIQQPSILTLYVQILGVGDVTINNTAQIIYRYTGLLNNGNVGLLGNTDSSNYPMFDNFQADSIGSPSGGRRRRHHVGHGRPFDGE